MSEREQFDAWFLANGFEKYRDSMWAAWQARAQLAAPAAQEVWCGCGDQIMPDDGARCGTCVAVKTAAPQGAGQ